MERAWSVDRTNGVTLVRCRLRNERTVPSAVRVESRLDGPVLAPRRNGVPENGWDRSGVTVRLDPGERRAVGFASPARPVEPPVAIEETETGGEGGTDDSDSRDAVRRLKTHRPPADVIEHLAGETGSITSGDGENKSDEMSDGDGSSGDDETPGDDEAPGGDGPSDAHETIDEWFTAVERRIERGERLDDADLASATEEIKAAGGVSALADLDRKLGDDVTHLRRLSERAASLAARAEATDVPIDAMETLAGETG